MRRNRLELYFAFVSSTRRRLDLQEAMVCKTCCVKWEKGLIYVTMSIPGDYRERMGKRRVIKLTVFLGEEIPGRLSKISKRRRSHDAFNPH